MGCARAGVGGVKVSEGACGGLMAICCCSCVTFCYRAMIERITVVEDTGGTLREAGLDNFGNGSKKSPPLII